MHISIQQSSSVFVNIFLSEVSKVGVAQSFFHRNTTSRIKIEHLHHKVQTILVKVLKISLRIHPFELGEWSLEVRQVVWITFNLRILDHWAGVGVPWNWNILKIWSISLSPQKRGFFSVNSEKMQPTAQMSTPKLYCFWPSNTSGALYQRVSI